MLYRRFESKDALAFYAMIKIIKTIQAATTTADGRGSILDLVVLQGTNGYEKLKYGLHGFIDQFLKFSAQVKFFAEFDSFYGDIYPDIQAADEYKEFIDLTEAVSWFSLADLIREGLQDGSIKTDLEPDYLAFCLVNAILSLLPRNILLAARLDKNAEVSRRSIYDSVDLMLAGLKA
jgi:AcrR family transcriptional regulator